MIGHVIAPSACVIAVCMAVLCLFPAIGFPATCNTANTAGWKDRNNDTPVSEGRDSLKCYLDSSDDHFRIFFNPCTETGCVDEQIDESNVEPMGDFLECAWQLFLGSRMSQANLVFEDLRPSDWLKHPVDPSTGAESYIPVWIDKRSEAAGASWRPRLHFSANDRLHNPVTPNAIHEFAHIIGYSHSDYAIPPARFANEGLATFHERVFRDPNSRRYSDVCFDDNVFLDLSTDSLQNRGYCEGARFWHFLSKFGNREGLSEFYEPIELAPACTSYSLVLDAVTDINTGVQIYPTRGEMRRIPGRDVIKAFYDRVAGCFPNHRTTPVCTENNGFYAKCSYPRYPALGRQIACHPDDGALSDLIADALYGMNYIHATTDSSVAPAVIDARKDAIDEGRRSARGMAMMPLLLDAVDQSALSVWPVNAPADPRSNDSIAFFMFRRFLEWNYEQPEQPAGSVVIDSVSSDGAGFVIQSFGAHYHQFDIAHDRARIALRRDDDLTEWAYAAFYIDDRSGGRDLIPVSNFAESGHAITSGWQQGDSDTIDVPMHSDFDKAVVIVTAFKGTFDFSTPSEVGHYQLTRLPPQIQVPSGTWPSGVGLPWIPWPYGPWPWTGNAPLPWGVEWPPRPDAQAYEFLPYGIGRWYEYQSPWHFGRLGWPGSAADSGPGYGSAWRTWGHSGTAGYRPYGLGGSPDYLYPWGYGDFGHRGFERRITPIGRIKR